MKKQIVNIGLVVTTITSISVGVLYPTFKGCSTERNRLSLNVGKLIVNDSLKSIQIQEGCEKNRIVNGRVDILTDDVKQIKSDVTEVKEIVSEMAVAIEELGGKINYQNIILKRNGETSDLHEGEYQESSFSQRGTD